MYPEDLVTLCKVCVCEITVILFFFFWFANSDPSDLLRVNSLFIMSMVAIWTVDNLHLQSLFLPTLRRYLKDTLDTLKQFSDLSPSVKHMVEVLENRLQEIDVP